MNREYIPLAIILLLLAFALLLPARWDPAMHLSKWVRRKRNDNERNL